MTYFGFLKASQIFSDVLDRKISRRGAPLQAANVLNHVQGVTIQNNKLLMPLHSPYDSIPSSHELNQFGVGHMWYFCEWNLQHSYCFRHEKPHQHPRNSRGTEGTININFYPPWGRRAPTGWRVQRFRETQLLISLYKVSNILLRKIYFLNNQWFNGGRDSYIVPLPTVMKIKHQ